MKRVFSLLLVAGLLILPAISNAQDSTARKLQKKALKAKWKDATPEERKAIKEKLKTANPEERQAAREKWKNATPEEKDAMKKKWKERKRADSTGTGN
ncbi:MAG TPA: hypothetical protein PKC39_05240 [Ferruginibacter sp.]|nr:hypothetical protein [Ferruginibacter sp.]HMP20346.1 hypothetical protein [Ferruginibacter sp.]